MDEKRVSGWQESQIVSSGEGKQKVLAANTRDCTRSVVVLHFSHPFRFLFFSKHKWNPVSLLMGSADRRDPETEPPIWARCLTVCGSVSDSGCDTRWSCDHAAAAAAAGPTRPDPAGRAIRCGGRVHKNSICMPNSRNPAGWSDCRPPPHPHSRA